MALCDCGNCIVTFSCCAQAYPVPTPTRIPTRRHELCVCALYAGAVVPLSFGLPLTQPAVQAVVGACSVAGLILGWFAPARRFSLVVPLAGVVSSGITLWAVAVLFPPAQHG